MVYVMLYDTEMFEEDYLQAMQNRLSRKGPVHRVSIFMGNEFLSVPILYDKVDTSIGNDRKTFQQLRTWYCWLQLKRGFGEILLAKRLQRIDKVDVRRGIQSLRNEAC